MINLSDRQLQTVMQAAQPLSLEKRDVYLQRIAAELARRGRFSDSDVAAAAIAAMQGLIQNRLA